MLTQLTQGLRWRWARMLAAMYLCCLLAPGVAYAFGDSVAARCALADLHAAATSHEHGSADAHHKHDNSAQSAHAMAAHTAPHHGAMHEPADDSTVAAHADFSLHGPASDTPSKNADKADQMCCGLACLSALPALLAAVSLPDVAAAVDLPLPEQARAALTPARLYKPPIA